MKLLQALRNASSRLVADFEDSKLFDHSGEKGEFREHITCIPHFVEWVIR
jgi:hypothetical protein